MWHCPHCGAPQAETARCWVCRRSSTTCSTCRHFCVSLAAEVGYCALDRHRRPLTGLELRACWEAASPSAEAASCGAGTGSGLEPIRISAGRRAPVPYGGNDTDVAPARGFVLIEDVVRAPASAAASDELPSRPASPAAPPLPARDAPAFLPGTDVSRFLPGEPIEGWESRTSLFGDLER